MEDRDCVLTAAAVEVGDICTGDDVEALSPSESSLVTGLGILVELMRGVSFGKVEGRVGTSGDIWDGEAVTMLGAVRVGCCMVSGEGMADVLPVPNNCTGVPVRSMELRMECLRAGGRRL